MIPFKINNVWINPASIGTVHEIDKQVKIFTPEGKPIYTLDLKYKNKFLRDWAKALNSNKLTIPRNKNTE